MVPQRPGAESGVGGTNTKNKQANKKPLKRRVLGQILRENVVVEVEEMDSHTAILTLLEGLELFLKYWKIVNVSYLTKSSIGV